MQHKHLPTWVLVADNCQAKIYRLVKFPKIEEIFCFEHPESRLRNQDLISEKPGSGFQQGGNIRYSYQPEKEPKRIEAEKFATELANFLSSSEKKSEFHRLYVIAEPSFLGLFRQSIRPEIQKTIIAEIPKTLTSSNIEAIEHLLTEI